LQHDYFTAYLAMSQEKPEQAQAIAAKYADYPVNRWREAFAAVTAQLAEIRGAQAKVVDAEDRGQQQTQLAATEPSFDFQVEAKAVKISYQNLAAVRVHYYLMDIELLFSRNPFVQQYSGQFSHIRPNAAQTLELPAGPDQPHVRAAQGTVEPQRTGRNHRGQPGQVAGVLLELAGRASDRERTARCG
jgi:hypothetical protein